MNAAKLEMLELEREREILLRKEAEKKYSDLSKRISGLEIVIDEKDQQIQELEAGREGKLPFLAYILELIITRTVSSADQ